MKKIFRPLERVLFVMDPIHRLDPVWDNSLALAREMAHRGIHTWWTDVRGLSFDTGRIIAEAHRFSPRPQKGFNSLAPVPMEMPRFNLVLLRKEPPFDEAYLHLTYLLECASRFVPVVNSPAGVRNASEKWAPILTQSPTPQTLVSASAQTILAFQKRKRVTLVIKRLDERGGRGILLLSRHGAAAQTQIRHLTRGGRIPVAVQKFIKSPRGADKRVLILNGRILGVFEKRPPPGEFRSNLSLGGTAHPATLTSKEIRLVKRIIPWLKKLGLSVAGLDVMGGKLLEVNVTSPAGFTDLEAVYPKERFTPQWLDFLERLPKLKSR